MSPQAGARYHALHVHQLRPCRTQTLSDTRHPEWDEVFAFGLQSPVDSMASLKVKVKEWTPSVSSSHTWLGQVTLPIEDILHAFEIANEGAVDLQSAQQWAELSVPIATRKDSQRKQHTTAQGSLKLMTFFYPGPPPDPQPLGAVLHVVLAQQLQDLSGLAPTNPYVRVRLTARNGAPLPDKTKFKTGTRPTSSSPRWYQAVYYHAEGVAMKPGDPEDTALQEVGLTRSAGPLPRSPVKQAPPSSAPLTTPTGVRPSRFLSHITEGGELGDEDAAAPGDPEADGPRRWPRHPFSAREGSDTQGRLLAYGPLCRLRAGASMRSLASAQLKPVGPTRASVLSAAAPGNSRTSPPKRRSRTWADDGVAGGLPLGSAVDAVLSKPSTVVSMDPEKMVALAEHKLQQVGDPYVESDGTPVFWLRFPDASVGQGAIEDSSGLLLEVRTKGSMGRTGTYGHVAIRWSALFGDESTVLTSHGLRCDRWWPLRAGQPPTASHTGTVAGDTQGSSAYIVGYLRCRLEVFYADAYLPLGWEESIDDQGRIYWTHITASAVPVKREPASVVDWRARHDLASDGGMHSGSIDVPSARTRSSGGGSFASAAMALDGRASLRSSLARRASADGSPAPAAGVASALATRKFFLAAHNIDAGQVGHSAFDVDTPLAAVTAQRRSSRQPDALSAAVMGAQSEAYRGRNDSVIYIPSEPSSRKNSNKMPPPAPPSRPAAPGTPEDRKDDANPAALCPAAASSPAAPVPALQSGPAAVRLTKHRAPFHKLPLTAAKICARLAVECADAGIAAATKAVGVPPLCLQSGVDGPTILAATLAAQSIAGVPRRDFLSPAAAVRSSMFRSHGLGRSSMVGGASSSPSGRRQGRGKAPPAMPKRASATPAAAAAAVGAVQTAASAAGRSCSSGSAGSTGGATQPSLGAAQPHERVPGRTDPVQAGSASSGAAPAAGPAGTVAASAAGSTTAQAGAHGDDSGSDADSDDGGNSDTAASAISSAEKARRVLGGGRDQDVVAGGSMLELLRTASEGGSEDDDEEGDVLADLGGSPGDREAAFFERMRAAKVKRQSGTAGPAAKRPEDMTPEEAAAAEEEAAKAERHERRKKRMMRQSVTTYGGGSNKRTQLLSRGRGRGKRK